MSSVVGFHVGRRRAVLLWLLAALIWVLGMVLHQYVILVQQQQLQSASRDSQRLPWIAGSTTTTFSRTTASEPHENDAGQQPRLARRLNTSALVILEQSKQRQEQSIDRSHYADYTFNGIPVTFHHTDDDTPTSRVHCIHEKMGDNNSGDTAWLTRSCLYQNLCLNVDTDEYVLFTNQQAGETASTIHRRNNNNTMVALGAINPRWTNRGFNMGVWKVQWAPTWQSTQDVSGYYALPDNYVLIPFHSLAAHNIGHLLWDDFYSIFSLLRIFGLLPLHQEQQSPPPLMNYTLLPLRHKIAETLYANCDIRPNKRQQCAHNLDRFLPLLGVDPVHFSTTQKAVLQIPNRQSPLVCAKQAVAGLGLLQDHGWHDHGWNGQGHRPHNLARGANFRAFGEFLVYNVLRHVPPPPPPVPVVRVVVSTLSSRDADRRLDFARQLQHLRQTVNDKGTTTNIQIDDYSMWEYSLADQVRLARQTHIWITTCGGGVMTATFLPAGSSLIVYYNPTGGLDFAHKLQATGQPARLDWDLLNNIGHLRVHWLPISTMDTAGDLELLTSLVRFEANVIVQTSNVESSQS